MKIYHIEVKGKVQGVSFRYYTFQKAVELGLKGIVYNTAQGSVKIEVAGNDQFIRAFVSWLYQGSPAARVSEIIVEPARDPHEYHTFEIRR